MSELKNLNIKDEIEKYVNHMCKHHDRLNVRDGKVIHDAIWGTRIFKDYEVALLDIPIIQRLRQIHQTGLAYLTFPSASHTRFEHTLGVTVQVSKLLEALRGKEENKSYINEDLINTLRISAIFHDAGHTPFSHAIEEIVESYPEIVKFKKDNHDKFGTAKAHEIFSAHILQSDRVRNLIKECVKGKAIIDIDLAAASIIGHSPDESDYYKIQVLNGPFDADKLDYVHRDGEASGLPLRVDLDRLWYSIDVSDITLEGKKSKRLTVDYRGMTSLEQILFTKMILFTTIYQHHKVRASECMLRGIIEYAKNKEIQICGHSLNSPVDFLYITDADIFGNNALLKDNNLHNLIHNLEYRRLLKRAIIISNNTIKKDSVGGYNKLLNIKDYKFLRELANEIWDGNKDCLKEEVWIDLPNRPDFKEADKAFITPLPGKKPITLSEFFPVGQWSKQYSFSRWRGHVFAPEKCKKEIAENSKKIFKREFGIKFEPEATDLCHNN